jgi:hypothetical protein
MFVGVEGARGEKVNTTTMVGSTLTYDTHLSTYMWSVCYGIVHMWHRAAHINEYKFE